MNTSLHLTDTEVDRILQAIRARLSQDGVAAAVAITDAHGELLAFVRTEGCPLPSIDIAIHKAFTAARERTKTSTLAHRSRDEQFPMTNFGDLRYTSFGGGVPILRDGTVIGGIGVSGLAEAVDEALALLGASAIVSGNQT